MKKMASNILIVCMISVSLSGFFIYISDQASINRHEAQEEDLKRLFLALAEKNAPYLVDGAAARISELERQTGNWKPQMIANRELSMRNDGRLHEQRQWKENIMKLLGGHIERIRKLEVENEDLHQHIQRLENKVDMPD